ncbi:MAG TPA: class I SAM-dependent methyltransferase [Flavisolibacter sp.]|nr:class I SAM-dependent methyltransferase [Flavisolibacter sp.]
MNRIHYTYCPVCNSTAINPLFTAKDHLVSKEEFVIWQCSSCTLRFTQDVPDEDSIAPYYQSEDYISHTNSDNGMLSRIYKTVRKRTLRQKADLIISQTKPMGKILDIGAGVGAFLNVMQEKGWNVTGVEPDEGARSVAKSSYNLNLENTSSLPNLTGKFDAITLWHVLEHVHQLHDYIEMLKKHLSADGRIFIAVPNYTALEADIYKLDWAAYDVPRHLYHFSPAAMVHLLQQHGLQVISKKPMWYDSFYISLMSSKYRKGKPSWIAAGFNGLRSNITALINKDRCSSLIYIVKK